MELRKDLSLRSPSSSAGEGQVAWRIRRPWGERTEGRINGSRLCCAHSCREKEGGHWPSRDYRCLSGKGQL